MPDGPGHPAPVPQTPTLPSLGPILDPILRPAESRLSPKEQIAKGGMGKIELVIDEALQRRLARKVLDPELMVEERNVKLFVREARVTGQLDHPNIVPVHEVGRDEAGRLWFTMKLVEGRTLREHILDLPEGRIAEGTLLNLLEVVVNVCDALAFAHSRGVLHCDVKPDNIMIGDFHEVYLMDWGIARVMRDGPEDVEAIVPPTGRRARRDTLVDAGDTSAQVMGTPGYMSREQAFGRRDEMDGRSDVFALGAVLYHILTRRPPFDADTYMDALLLAQGADVTPPSEVSGDWVPPELERIVLKAMARFPDDRYSTVDAMRGDIVRFMRGGAEFPTATFPPGVAVVREGDSAKTAYFILSGLCEVQKRIDGKPVRIRTLGPGEVFGELALLTGEPRTASIVTLEETELQVVGREHFEKELAALKPWMSKLLRTLASRFHRADAQLHKRDIIT